MRVANICLDFRLPGRNFVCSY